MSNEVEIHVKWEDSDSAKFAAETKARAKVTGEKAGDQFSDSLKVKATKGGETAGKAAGDGIEKGMKDGARKGGKDVDDEMSRVAERANKSFDAKAFAGLSLGLPAAAAVGAAGAGAALAAVPALFIGLGAAALKGNAQVADSFAGLKTHVVGDTQSMAGVLAGPLAESAGQLGASFDRLRPQIQSAMAGSAGAVHELTGSVTDFAENAMPGMVTAVKASQPAFEGLHSFAGQAGTGLSTFFGNLSQGSAGAGQGLTILGGTVAKLEGSLGTLFANLANGSSGPLRSLDVIVGQVSNGLLDLTSKGSGAMGALQGFTTTGSGLVTVLRGVATAAAALPPEVTQFAGAIGASSMVLSKFGVDASKSFEGLGGKISAAEGAGAKLKTGLGGLAAGALSPATAATAGLGVALLLMGQDAERAEHAQATLAATQRTFTDALRSSKGALDDNVRASVAQDLAQKNINGNSKSLLDFARQFGVALPQVTSAVLGESGALDGVNQQLDAYAKANPDAATTVNALKVAIAAKGVAFRDGTSAVAAEAAATDQSTEAQNRNRDSINAVTEAIYQQQNAQLGYRGAVLNSKQALDEYGKTLKSGKATDDEKAQGLLRVEQAFASQEQAAYQAAYANSTAKVESGKVAEALAAENRETVNLANSFQGALPQSLEQTIGKMSATQAQAAGLTVAVDGTGAAVYRLPDGKFIKIDSSAAGEAQKVADLQRAIDSIHDRNIKIAVTTFYGTVGQGQSLTGPAVARAKGGLVGYASGGSVSSVPRFDSGGYALDVGPGGVLHGPGSGTSDSIFARVSNGEFVVKASETRKNLPLLNAINDGRGSFGGLGGGAMSQSPSRGGAQSGMTLQVELVVNTGGHSDFERMFAEMIRHYVRVNGGGNVQSAFGQR